MTVPRVPIVPLVPLVLAAVLLGTAAPPVREYPVRAVPHGDVELADGFWRARLEVNRTASIPAIHHQNELTGRVANFERAAGLKPGQYEGRRFNDTDIYKWIEAASYSLKRTPDAALSAQIDRLVDLIARSQESDGYLMPARSIDPASPAPGMGPERWVHLNGSHELYNFGHLYEAAIAHVEATGKRTLLDVALKNANLVAVTFGPGKLRAVPGHEEIELALMRLWVTTGVPRYYETARFFLDQRGRDHQTQPYPDGPFAMYNGRDYKQDHRPVVEQDRAVGHAVRAMYLYTAMADQASLGADKTYLDASARIWRDMIAKRMYITGGVGSRGTVEAFGDDYELPNRTAYTETCASAGNVFWNARMFQATGQSRYLDVLERTLYNGLLSGVSLDGKTFFYQNPLESNGRAARSEYFDVACCPANLARTLAQMPGYVYAYEGETIFVNLFVGSRARVPLGRGAVVVTQDTNYPWDGDIRIRVEPASPRTFTVAFRNPGWAGETPLESDLYKYADARRLPPPQIEVNGETFIDVRGRNGFITIMREWKAGDEIRVRLPMPVRRVLAHDGVKDAAGKTAFERGPLVYAVEAADNGGAALDLRVPSDARLDTSFKRSLLGGVQVVTGQAYRGDRRVTFTAVPYFAWSNRGQGEMAVWVRER